MPEPSSGPIYRPGDRAACRRRLGRPCRTRRGRPRQGHRPGLARRLLPDSWRSLPYGRGELLATRCPRCDALTFPVASTCPACWNTGGLRTEPVAAPGVVYAVTGVRVPESGIEPRTGSATPTSPAACALRPVHRLDVVVGDPVEVVSMAIRQRRRTRCPGGPPQGGPMTLYLTGPGSSRSAATGSHPGGPGRARRGRRLAEGPPPGMASTW